MLVLSRKKNEQIRIDGNIVVMVVEVRGDKVRLGIDAPRDVTVHREEIAEKIRQERDAAAANRSVSEPAGETGYGQVIEEQLGDDPVPSDQFPTIFREAM